MLQTASSCAHDVCLIKNGNNFAHVTDMFHRELMILLLQCQTYFSVCNDNSQAHIFKSKDKIDMFVFLSQSLIKMNQLTHFVNM